MTARSVSAIKSQSAGLAESVFRGKENPFVEDRLEKEVADCPFLLQSPRRDRDQGESRLSENWTHGPSVLLCCKQLPLGPFGHETEIDIAICPGLTAGV